MASSAWANYSNQASALRGSIYGPAENEGQEREDDKKAFVQELLNNGTTFAKEKAMESGGKLFTSSKLGRGLIKATTGKDTTPLRTARLKAEKALADFKNEDNGAEGLAEATARNELTAQNDAALADKANLDDQLSQTTSDLNDAKSTATDTSSALEASQAAERQAQIVSDAKSAEAESFRTENVGGGTDAIQEAADGEASAAQEGLRAASARTADAAAQDSAAASRVDELQQQFDEHSEMVDDAAKTLASKGAAAAEEGERVVAKGEKLESDLSKATKAEEVGDEDGDPIQLVLTAITAVVSGMIGSRMKVHTVVQPPAPNIAERSSYGSTVGA
tara:strand:+ start:405 stop:1409 length:1005 start_codon:yes stop_codon:yes gene_type:complete